MSQRSVDHLVLTRQWLPIHPQVYVVGGTPPSWHGQLFAACLWSKDGVASHLSAGALWELPNCGRGRPEITVQRCHLAPRSGIIVHFTNIMPPRHVTERSAIPATSIERTLLDLGAVLPCQRVAHAVDDALRRKLTDFSTLRTTLDVAGGRGRRGAGVLRKLLEERHGLRVTAHSPLETDLFELIAGSDLPLPEMQHSIIDRGHFIRRVDFVYPDASLILEVDSWKHHSGRADWEYDVNWRNELTMLGWTILHLTASDIRRHPDRTLRRIHQLIISR